MSEPIFLGGDDETAVLSDAVVVGDVVYVSGQASTDPDSGVLIPGTFEEEYRRAIDNLERVLARSGCVLTDVVRVGAYVQRESDLPRFNELYRETFPYPRPARTTIRMGFEFLLFEIDAIAVLPSSR